MHEYNLKKEEISELSPSQVGVLIEMVGCRKNPDLLKKYKTLKFNSEFEFDQYLLEKMKFI